MKIFPTKMKAPPKPEHNDTLEALAQTVYIPSLAELQKFYPDKAIYT